MQRTRDYTRKMRAKHIKRKKSIVHHWKWFGEYYPHDGMYSKGKIHCSCRMCRGKDYNGNHILTKQEIASIEKMKEDSYLELGTS